MGVTTARAAGVAEIAVCSPPGPDGELSPVVLAACALAGADAVYRMGGAQAIAALAYGTESVNAVDVIVGPGNLYVQEAKLQVCGEVGIDGFAGPSDLLVIADPGCDPAPLAADLLAQAEHGEATIVVALSPDQRLLEALQARLAAAPETGAVARLVAVCNAAEAMAIAQAFAPEHLQLVGPEAQALAPRATHAGCVFIGPEGAGKSTFTTLPLGAITLIGRKQPELRGIDGSVMCRMALKLADQATPSVALIAPLAWRSDLVKSTITSPSWMWVVTAMV